MPQLTQPQIWADQADLLLATAPDRAQAGRMDTDTLTPLVRAYMALAGLSHSLPADTEAHRLAGLLLAEVERELAGLCRHPAGVHQH